MNNRDYRLVKDERRRTRDIRHRHCEDPPSFVAETKQSQYQRLLLRHKSWRIAMTSSFLLLFSCLLPFLVFPAYAVEESPEEALVKMREQEVQAKQDRVQGLQDKINAFKRQLEEEQKNIRGAQEGIYKEFSQGLELERKQLKEQLEGLEHRQVLFEKEFQRRQVQDEISIKEKTEELDHRVRELDRLRGELSADQKLLNDATEQLRAFQAEQITQTAEIEGGGDGGSRHLAGTRIEEAPHEGTLLEDGGLKISGVPGSEIMNRPVEENPPVRAPRRVRPEYYVEIGDVLDIDVWRVPDVSRPVTVRPDGRISMPLVGDLDVIGLNLVDIKQIITTNLAEYVRNPHVSISVRQFGGRKFVILGEINSPGVFRFQQDISLLEGIALAGGFKEGAKRGQIMVIRGDIENDPQVKIISANLENVLRKGMLTENLTVLPNDIIYVAKNFLGDYHEVIDDLIKPALNTTIDFFVLRSAVRISQQKRN